MHRVERVAEQVDDVLLLGGSSASGRVGSSPSSAPTSGASDTYDSTAPYPVITSRRASQRRMLPASISRSRKPDRPLEQRSEHRRELLDQHRAALEGLPAGEPHEVGALLEEPERGAQHPFHLGPSLTWLDRRGLVHDHEPVVERVEQHRAVQRDLRREVVEEARGADPDVVGDVGQTGAGESVLGEPLSGDDAGSCRGCW